MGNHTRALAAFLIALSLVAATSLAGEVTDNTYGYTVRLPDGWKQVPDAVLQQARNALARPGAAGAPNFVAAFEPASHVQPFQYPYVMVQIQAYPAGTSLATISRSEVEDLTAKLTGLPASELKKNVSDNAAKLMGDTTLERAAVTTNPPGFTMGTSMNVAGVGPIRGRSVCLFGRTNTVMLHFYAKQPDWANQAAALQAFEGSFRRTSGQGVTFSDKTVDTTGKTLSSGGGGFDWSSVWSKALIGGIIGGIIGLFSWLKKRGARS